MGLVDHDERHRHVLETVDERLRHEPLGRDIEKLALAIHALLIGAAHFGHRQACMHVGGFDATAYKVVDLILHQ